MNHYRYEELQVGHEESFSREITADMMRQFLSMTGDVNPLHNDEGFAVSCGYQGRVVYGMLTASLISTLGGVYLPGEFCLIQSVEVKFAKPVYIGDVLTVSGRVQEMNDTVCQVAIKVSICNQNGEKVSRGKLKIGFLQER